MASDAVNATKDYVLRRAFVQPSARIAPALLADAITQGHAVILTGRSVRATDA